MSIPTIARTVPARGDEPGRTADAQLAGLIGLRDPHRPPHPGGRPCCSLCVPACARPPLRRPA